MIRPALSHAHLRGLAGGPERCEQVGSVSAARHRKMPLNLLPTRLTLAAGTIQPAQPLRLRAIPQHKSGRRRRGSGEAAGRQRIRRQAPQDAAKSAARPTYAGCRDRSAGATPPSAAMPPAQGGGAHSASATPPLADMPPAQGGEAAGGRGRQRGGVGEASERQRNRDGRDRPASRLRNLVVGLPGDRLPRSFRTRSTRR